MYQRTSNDECLMCYSSLLKGADIISILINDSLCYECRHAMNSKIKVSKFMGFKLITFYDYDNISQLLIRYKDYCDIPLADIFLTPYKSVINIIFKKWTIVPIPSSETMMRHRGFKHLDLMIDCLNLPVSHCLSKEDQVQRFSPHRKVHFHLNNPVEFENVILFDDVITSGNSMNEAIRLIEPYSKKIVIISVARNLKAR